MSGSSQHSIRGITRDQFFFRGPMIITDTDGEVLYDGPIYTEERIRVKFGSARPKPPPVALIMTMEECIMVSIRPRGWSRSHPRGASHRPRKIGYVPAPGGGYYHRVVEA